MSSIRGKIILGYLALTAGVGGFVLFASADLLFLERHVHEGVAVSAFQETAQEMRRHEKNYFLYRARGEAGADLAAARAAAAQMAASLDSADLVAVARGDELSALKQALGRYRSLLERAAPPESALRAAGHDLSLLSEHLAERERASLVATVRQSRHALLWSVGVLVLLALAGGQLLYRAVGRPLRQLEEQLEPLAQGRFRTFSMVSTDREIVSFTQALNRMLEELDLRRRQVLQSEKLASLGTLASGVAHELNNPLGNISGAAQIALEEIESLPEAVRAELRAWLKQIDDETERARHIVLTLLDYSRRPMEAAEPIPLREALEKCLLLLGPRLPEADSVRLDVPAELRLKADPRRLQQVFINLIQNAFAAGARHIHILARPAITADWPPASAALVLGDAAPNARAALIEVSDDGPGIAAEHISQVFDPFFTTRAPGEGTGLGLYIVSEIVLDQGGALAVASSPGGGTCFTLWLPCGVAQ
jgi:signal transduction histidine kinase